jgi:hypothetical protein
VGTAKRVGAPAGGAGLALEYVRSRRIVRLLGWCYDEALDPVEIPVDRLCQELGIDPSELGTPRRYLLFGGSGATPGGGLRDLVATFDSELEAREAFRQLRQQHPATSAWAELAAIDSCGQLHQLAWFGPRPNENDTTARRAAPAAVAPLAERRRGLRRFLSSSAGDDGEPYLRAVTPS